ncbi:unnamed protein product [Blepharisma stoltei]|uniref:Uncharacterized protein n=1 Tax=Blepharisma stoltei TaxID=1481888 RepID=A0AAU9IJE3_9CILI|nr:unnamed protein product [Blepharisma stoltei]
MEPRSLNMLKAVIEENINQKFSLIEKEVIGQQEILVKLIEQVNSLADLLKIPIPEISLPELSIRPMQIKFPQESDTHQINQDHLENLPLAKRLQEERKLEALKKQEEAKKRLEAQKKKLEEEREKVRKLKEEAEIKRIETHKTNGKPPRTILKNTQEIIIKGGRKNLYTEAATINLTAATDDIDEKRELSASDMNFDQLSGFGSREPEEFSLSDEIIEALDSMHDFDWGNDIFNHIIESS